MTPEFELLNNLFGWGDPGNAQARGCWFVGIEEYDDYKTAEDVRRIFNGKQVINNFEEIRLDEERFQKWDGQTHNYSAKIMCLFSPETQQKFKDSLESNPESWKQESIWRDHYRRKLLWYPGSGVCNANLFPLGKARTGIWPLCNKELYGFAKEDIKKYKEYVRKTRFVKMRELWEKCNPQATICFVNWNNKNDIEQLFQIGSEWIRLTEGVFCNDEKHVVITPHFSGSDMSNPKAAIVQHQLKVWEVRLPR